MNEVQPGSYNKDDKNIHLLHSHDHNIKGYSIIPLISMNLDLGGLFDVSVISRRFFHLTYQKIFF